MTGKRKDFSGSKPAEPLLLIAPSDSNRAGFTLLEACPPLVTRVVFGTNARSSRSFDFGPRYGRGFDEIVLGCQRSVEHLIKAGKLSLATVSSYCSVGMTKFLDFCEAWCKTKETTLHIKDIDLELTLQYAKYLARRGIRPLSQSVAYRTAKNVLVVLSDHGILPPISSVFQEGLYPNMNREPKGAQPLSESERQRFVDALKPELVAIFKGHFEGVISEALAICYIAICLRAGRNTTPMLELSRDALREHPFMSNLRLLTTYKGRSHSKYLTPLQKAELVESSTVINLDAVAIYTKVKELTEQFVCDAPKELKNRLWIFRCVKSAYTGQVRALSDRRMRDGIEAFIRRRNLQGDDGKPLVLNTSRLRKTLVNRLWRLSGGDPFAVARLAGHSVKVMDSHYLLPTLEMERDHKFLGEALVTSWRGKMKSGETARSVIPISTENTPVGKCSDPYQGERAPKSGNACVDFLSCFRCRSFVITDDEEDLHRLYSFYWFIVRERERIGKSQWGKVYGWIMRMIDEQVTSKFSTVRVARTRREAHDHPHPFWSNSLHQEMSLGR